MILFTKKDCTKCDYIKSHFNLNALGIEIAELNESNAQALADLAYFELVETAEKQLPILVTNHSEKITGAIPISRFLNNHSSF